MSELTTGKVTQQICKAIKSVYSRLGGQEHDLQGGTSLCATQGATRNVILIGENNNVIFELGVDMKLHESDTA